MTPQGRVVAHVTTNDTLVRVAVRNSRGFLLRIPGYADFELNEPLDVVRVWHHPGVDAELVDLLLIGPLSTLLLELRGALVLHASAVMWPAGTVAISAQSGGGKSTIAGLLCATGASLHTDDLLHVSWDVNDVPTAWRGVAELRLRDRAHGLTALLSEADHRTTADGRLALSPRRTPLDASPLRAIVLPHLRRGGPPGIVAEPVGSPDALLALLARPRMRGWCDTEVLAQQFRQLARLVEQVPIVRLSMPWGQQFDPTFAKDVDATCRGLVEEIAAHRSAP